MSFLEEAGATLLFTSGLLICGFLALLVYKYVARIPWTYSWHIRTSHSVQPLMQGSILLYMALWSNEVVQLAPLIAYQLVFAYAFDILLGLALKREARLGLSVFPIVMSINLFMWFRPDYFYLQILVVAAAVASKYVLLRRSDEGVRHIFNPSALSMVLACLALIACGEGRLVMVPEIISAYSTAAPSIFFVIFVAGSISIFVGRVALVSLSSVLTLYLVFHVSQMVSDLPLINVWITPSIFVGTMLLVTDPRTCPRTRDGQIAFGIGYGLLIVCSYGFLSYMHAPGYYEKILPVPLLNLAVPYLDRLQVKENKLSPRSLGAIYGLVFLALFPYDKRPEHQMSVLGKLGGAKWARMNRR